LQNHPPHGEGVKVQNMSEGSVRRLLRVAASSNMAVKAAPFGRWTLRDKSPRSAPYLQR
jgi:hypothetical protein